MAKEANLQLQLQAKRRRKAALALALSRVGVVQEGSLPAQK